MLAVTHQQLQMHVQKLLRMLLSSTTQILTKITYSLYCSLFLLVYLGYKQFKQPNNQKVSSLVGKVLKTQLQITDQTQITVSLVDQIGKHNRAQPAVKNRLVLRLFILRKQSQAAIVYRVYLFILPFAKPFLWQA